MAPVFGQFRLIGAVSPLDCRGHLDDTRMAAARGPVSLRAQVDARDAGELRRPIQFPALEGLGALRRQGAVVDPLGPARLLQRPVGRPRPASPGVLEPLLAVQRAAFPCPALLRLLPVVTLEPPLGVAVVTIEGAFGNHQADVGILPAAPAEGHRVGQPFPSGECVGEASGEGPLLGRVQFLRQRALHCDKQPPVDPFVCVRGGPIPAGIVCGPLRHVPALAVSELIAVCLTLPFPCDVLGPGAGRLPTVTAAGLHIQMIDSHRVPSARPGSSSAISVRSPGLASPAEAMRPRPRPFAALRVLSSMRSPETVFASSSLRCQKDFPAITRLHSGACSSLHAAVISSTAPPSSTIRPVRPRVPASARARAHGSTLREIESPSGPGTHFTCSLPLSGLEFSPLRGAFAWKIAACTAADDTCGFKFGLTGISSLPGDASRFVYGGERLRWADIV